MLSNLGDDDKLRAQRAASQSRSWARWATQWAVQRTLGPTPVSSNAEPLPRRGIHRVLVCRVSHTLGNTLLITPLIQEIEQVFPGCEIDIVTRSQAGAAIFGQFDRVRRVFEIPNHGISSPHRIASVIRALRTQTYDLAIDPGLLSTTDRLYVRLANAKWKIGYATKSTDGLTHAIDAPIEVRHVGKVPVYLLREAMKDAQRGNYPSLGIALTFAERAWGRAMLDEVAGRDGPVVALFTAATGDKHVGAAWWHCFATRYADAMPEARIVEIVPLSGQSVLDRRWPTYYTTDLRRLASVLSVASRFVSADCGVMHLACASNVPTAGLFRGTDITEWGPYGMRDLAFDVTSMPPDEVASVLAAIDERSMIP